jgi:DNA mismatch repair protein MutS
MGGRLLRSWILNPLIDIDDIKQRQEAVGTLLGDKGKLAKLKDHLKGISDIERLSSRVSIGTVNARELLSLKNSLALLPQLKDRVKEYSNRRINYLSDGIDMLSDVQSLILKTIADDPPLGLKDGGLIKSGVDKDIDELREISGSGKDFIASLQSGEREKTGISSLKVGYNKIHGYYIEVTKPNLLHVPEHYIRKQTLVNGERFITPELKEYEAKILGAEDRLKKLEFEYFEGIRGKISVETDRIQKTAEAVAELDSLHSLAYIADRYNYVCPAINDGNVIKISSGRHPVIERLSSGEKFVPNDTLLDTESQNILIITGPNMAGKSTYMRQVALIVLLAQIGSFVPAADAVIGVVDRIFTRIGASDVITRGQSTFMVEMNKYCLGCC